MRRTVAEGPGRSRGPPASSEDDPSGKRKSERQLLVGPYRGRCTILSTFVCLVCTLLIILGSDKFAIKTLEDQKGGWDYAEANVVEGRVSSAGIGVGLGRKGPTSRTLSKGGQLWSSIISKSGQGSVVETPYQDLKIHIYSRSTLQELSGATGDLDLRKESSPGCCVEDLIRQSNVYTPTPQLADFFLVPEDAVLSFEGHNGVSGGAADPLVNLVQTLSSNYPFWNQTGGRDHIFQFTTERSLALLQESSLNLLRKSIFLLKPVPRDDPRFDTWKDIVVPPGDCHLTGTSEDSRRPNREANLHRPHLLFVEKPEISTNAFKRLSESSDGDLEGLLVSDSVTCNATCTQQQMAESKYCLCTGPVFNKLFSSAVQQGCVPVLEADAPELPFEAILDYSRFTVKISNQDPLDVLKGVPSGLLLKKQAALREAARSFEYGSGWLSGGPFDLLLDELKRRKRFFRNSSQRFWTKALPFG